MIPLWVALLVLLCTPPFAYVGWSLATRSDILGIYERALRVYTGRPALPPAHDVQERIARLELDLRIVDASNSSTVRLLNSAVHAPYVPRRLSGDEAWLSYSFHSDPAYAVTLSAIGKRRANERPEHGRALMRMAEIHAKTSGPTSPLLDSGLEVVRTKSDHTLTADSTLSAIDAYAEHLRKRKDAQS